MLSYFFPNSKNDIISILCFNQGSDKITSYFNSYFPQSAALVPKNMKISKIINTKNGYLLIFDIYIELNNQNISFCKAYFTLNTESNELVLINIKKIKGIDNNKV